MTRDAQHEQFERWIADHIAILHRVVNGFAEGEDRNDLMQEVLLAVWRSIPSFRGRAQASTFIYRVSHNAALTWRRGQRNYTRRLDQAKVDASNELVFAASAPDEQLELLYSAIRALPEIDRSLVLIALDGLSYQEMAAVHGLSETNVGARLSRAKQRLSAILNERKTNEHR